MGLEREETTLAIGPLVPGQRVAVFFANEVTFESALYNDVPTEEYLFLDLSLIVKLRHWTERSILGQGPEILIRVRGGTPRMKSFQAHIQTQDGPNYCAVIATRDD